MVTTNLPVVFPFLSNALVTWSSSILSSVRTSKKSSANHHVRDVRTWGQGSLSRDQRRRRGPPTANPITDPGGSEERMIDLQERRAASVGSESQMLAGKKFLRNEAGANDIDVEVEVSVTQQAREDVEMGISPELRSQSEGHFAFARGGQVHNENIDGRAV